MYKIIEFLDIKQTFHIKWCTYIPFTIPIPRDKYDLIQMGFKLPAIDFYKNR